MGQLLPVPLGVLPGASQGRHCSGLRGVGGNRPMYVD